MRATDCFRVVLGGSMLAGIFLGAVALQAQPPTLTPGNALIADVRIQGNGLIPAQQIMAQLKTRPGIAYAPEVVQEDVRTLFATKLYGNIQSVVRPEADGRVTVYFFIRDLPTVIDEVTYQGAKHLSQDELDKLTGIRKGTPLNPTANRLACRAILAKLNDQGRPFASCDLLSGGQPGDTRVVFKITEGPKVGVVGVRFVGNRFVSGSRLGTLIDSKAVLGVFPGPYNPQLLEADLGKLQEYYKKFGFLDAHLSRELQLTENGRNVNVVFHVQEGPRYTVRSTPQIRGNRALPIEQLEQLCRVKAGQFYNQTDVDADLSLIKDYYGYTGRDVRVQAVPVFNRDLPGVCAVQYEVDERPLVLASPNTTGSGGYPAE